MPKNSVMNSTVGGQPPTVVLDTNCFVDAVNSASHAHEAVTSLLRAAELSRVRISVSLHSIHELELADAKYKDGALQIARRFPVLPYFPIGTFKDLLGTFNGVAGTFDDMRVNAAREAQLQRLAKSGNDLRDRGALIDAARAQADIFVTSDGQLSKAGPAKRIGVALGIRVLTPKAAVEELC